MLFLETVILASLCAILLIPALGALFGFGVLIEDAFRRRELTAELAWWGGLLLFVLTAWR